MEEEWVSPKELLQALEGPQNDEGSKIDAIIRRLRGKQLAAKAEAVLINGKPSGQTVPAQIWITQGADNPQSDWVRGDFVLVTSGETCRRYEAFGVKFSKGDAVKMGANFDKPAPAAVNSTGIQKLPKWNWEAALTELIAIAEKDNLVDTFRLHEHGGQARLQEWFLERLQTADGMSPSPSEAKKRAKAIMSALPSV